MQGPVTYSSDSGSESVHGNKEGEKNIKQLTGVDDAFEERDKVQDGEESGSDPEADGCDPQPTVG